MVKVPLTELAEDIFRCLSITGSFQVFEYNGEGNFGELALLYNMPRAATVQVLT